MKAQYDAISTEEQAETRSFWAEKMAALTSTLDLERKLTAQGRAYVELDDSGEVVRRGARPPE